MTTVSVGGGDDHIVCYIVIQENIETPPADQICLIMCDTSLKHSKLSPASCHLTLLTGCSHFSLGVTGF